MVFLGLAAMADPPRPEAAHAVAMFKRAHVRTVMITGDHRDTALAIARRLGIAEDGTQCISGAELDRMDDAMFQSVQEKGAYLRSRIEALDLPCLGATRGMGLMIGIDVKGERTNKELAAKLIQSGLLVLTAGPGLRLLPPLVITQEEMDKGLAILKAALS